MALPHENFWNASEIPRNPLELIGRPETQLNAPEIPYNSLKTRGMPLEYPETLYKP